MSNIGTDEYTLKLLDQITAPLRKIEESMSKVVKTAEKLEKMASGGLGLAKVAAGVAAAVVGFNVLSNVVSGAIHLLEKLASVTWNVGKGFAHAVIEAARFRTQSITSLELFLGDGKGERSFNKLLEIGKFLPMDERDVVKQGAALAAAGYKGRRLDAVNAALSDVMALRGEFYRSNLEFHFLRLKNEARPDARDVKMAAIDTGVGMEGIMKHLFKLKGVAMPKGLHEMEQLYEHLKKSGKVTGTDVADAILMGINERMNKGQGLGSAALRLGMGTLSGLLTNLEAAPMRFLAQMKLEKMEGVKALMRFIERLLVFFNLATPQGKKLAEVVERMINTLFGGLDKIDEKALTKFFEGALRIVEQVVRALEQTWDLLGRFASGEALGGSAVKLIAEIGKIFGAAMYEGFKAAWKGQKEPARPSMFTQGPGRGVSEGLTAEAVGKGRAAGPFRDLRELRRLGEAANAPRATLGGPRGAVGFEDIFPAPLPTLPQAPRSSATFIQPGDFGPKAPPLALPSLVQGPGAALAPAPPTAHGPPTPSGPSFRDFGQVLGPSFSEFGDAFGAGQERGQNVVRGALRGMDQEGEMHSPSRAAERRGEYLVDGLLLGIERRIALIESGASDPLLDRLAQLLRHSAMRVGAPLPEGR